MGELVVVDDRCGTLVRAGLCFVEVLADRIPLSAGSGDPLRDRLSASHGISG